MIDKVKQRVLIIGTVWPEPCSSAAGSRMIQLIKFFQQHACEITFASAAGDSLFAANLKDIGINKVSIELNNNSFDLFIKELDPAIVLFDRFMLEEQYGWRVQENCPLALRLLDTEDLHCLRAARQKVLKEDRELTRSDLMNDVAMREIASIYRCDLSLIISEYEMRLLQDTFKVPGEQLHYLPFMLDAIDETQWMGFSERQNFVTIGNFLHAPNVDALLYLKNELWPFIKKELPDCKVYNYGAYPSEFVMQQHKPSEGFHVMGRAVSAKEIFANARVCIAPLRFGAGLKGKLIDAMRAGTPSVTTDIGAEGMHGDLDWCGIISNTSFEIAKAAVKLYTDEELWKTSQEKCKAILEKRFSKEQHSSDLLDRILTVQNNLEKHRLDNFTGAILMHHTIASTKYMSRWIELKNNIPGN